MQNNTHVSVLARITAPFKKIGEPRCVLLQFREETRKENDCVTDQLFQNKANQSDFTIVEEWANDVAIDSHMATTKAFAKATPLRATTTKLKDISFWVA